MKVQAKNWQERSRSKYMVQIGELTLYWYGEVLLGVRTSDGCFKRGLYDFCGSQKDLMRKKQKGFGMQTWGDGVSAKKLYELAGNAAVREFGTYARARMAGET